MNQTLEVSQSEIFNTDQGSQFTSRLEKEDIRISMDGRGRVYDNIFVERLWRSVKDEEVYLHHYQTVSEARNGLATYFLFLNMERLHESLGYQSSYEIYVKDRLNINPMQASIIHLI
jgi:putative transposase